MENKKILFKDLSIPLKIATISSWIWIIAFIVSFFLGLLGGLFGYL
jgi:hypothetical protein